VTHPQLDRLIGIMSELRSGCPWDAEQTHRSLVAYLVEETLEVVEAIEVGDDDALSEELGDLLLQVVFHAQIAAEQARFDIEDVARRIGDKLVARHPYVFSDADVPVDMMQSWEAAKRAEKGRTSALDGIPDRLSALTRMTKVVSRARWHNVDIDAPDHVITATEVGEQMLSLVARAQASGIDAEQAARDALRNLEARVRAAESSGEG
jgi:XTP/dITP diphosphohydrolase